MPEGDSDAANDPTTSDQPAADEDPPAELDAVAELERLLLARGPLTLVDLADVVAVECPDLAASLGDGSSDDLLEGITEVARKSDAFWRLPDERVAPVLHHLRRATFTHRLTGDELAREAVDLCPDLAPLVLPSTFTLPDGTEVRTGDADDEPRAAGPGSLLGPSGWLTAYAAGDLVAVRYDGEQARFDPIGAAALDEAAGRAVSEALGRAHGALPAARAPEAHRLVVDAIGAEPTCFAVPVAPVAELLAAVDLGVREAWVGPSGEPWQTPLEQARVRQLEKVLAGAERCCRQAARRALDAWQAWMAEPVLDDGSSTRPGVDGATAGRLVEDVEHGPTAAVLAEVATVGQPLPALRGLGEWSTALAEEAEGSRAGVEYLRAVGADAGGDAPAVEAHLRSGLEADAEDAACLLLLAELTQDRGDAERSLQLLREAGRPPGPDELRALQPFLVDRRVGRNEPCPCGSGRKYKTCCWGRPIRRPLPERCHWLLRKAIRHATRTHGPEVESMRRFFAVGEDDQQATGLAEDMLLFSRRGLGRYLAARGPLVPEDELAIARGWPDRPMRLVELGATRAVGTVDAVDVVTGEPLAIADPDVDRFAAGDTVLARLLPVEEQWLLGVVAIPVPASGRDTALRMLEHEVRPVHLVELLVDLQVEAITAGGLHLPAPAPGAAPQGGPRLP